MIAMTVRGGDTYRGRTIETTTRRVWGRNAFFRYSNDPNSPEAGMVLTPSRVDQRAFNIEAVILTIEVAP